MKPLFLMAIVLSWCAPAFSADSAPAVFLSHFNIALDQVTYDALRSSAQLAALAAVEERNTTAGDHGWTGFYVYGRQTYMEFFGADNLPEDTLPGDCGLALTVEESGGAATLAARLRKTFGKSVSLETTTRTMPTGPIPWFTSTFVDNGSHYALPTWLMEVNPTYLAASHPGSPIDDPLSRQQYLSWNYRADRLLDNVTAITAALGPEESSALATELALVGWQVRQGDRGFVATGPAVELRVIPAGARAGIQQVELRLRRPVARQTVSLGHAQLRLLGNTAQLVMWK
jgi:hypothetical protein